MCNAYFKISIYSLFVHMPLLRHNAIYQSHQTELSEQAVDDFTYLYYSTKLTVFVYPVRFKLIVGYTGSLNRHVTALAPNPTYTVPAPSPTLKCQRRSANSVLNHACVAIR